VVEDAVRRDGRQVPLEDVEDDHLPLLRKTKTTKRVNPLPKRNDLRRARSARQSCLFPLFLSTKLHLIYGWKCQQPT
jgi:hypothetical protein